MSRNKRARAMDRKAKAADKRVAEADPPRVRSIVKPTNPAETFRQPALRDVVATREKDGAMRVALKPQRRREFSWHSPNVFVDERQWRPAMGITRYEFARRETPRDQRALFEKLQLRYQVEGPPMPAPNELWERVAEARKTGAVLPNGLPGEDLGDALFEEVRRYTIREYSPDGQWSFMVQAVHMSGDGTALADRLDVRHRDYRTVADYELLVRFHSWVLPDNRTRLMIWPGIDIHSDGWEGAYENETPNNLQIISPRLPGDEGSDA